MTHTWSVPRWPYRLSRRLSFADEHTRARRVRAAQPLRAGPAAALVAAPRLPPGARLPPRAARRRREVVRTSQSGIDLPARAGLAAWPRRPAGRRSTSPGCTPAWAGRPSSTRRLRHPSAPWPPTERGWSIDWERGFAPVLGIWLSYGGWPAERTALRAGRPGAHHVRARRPRLGAGRWPGTAAGGRCAAGVVGAPAAVMMPMRARPAHPAGPTLRAGHPAHHGRRSAARCCREIRTSRDEEVTGRWWI